MEMASLKEFERVWERSVSTHDCLERDCEAFWSWVEFGNGTGRCVHVKEDMSRVADVNGVLCISTIVACFYNCDKVQMNR